MSRRSTNAANEGCAMALGALFLLALIIWIIKWVLIIAAFAVPIMLLVLAGRHLYLRHQQTKAAARQAFDEYHRQAAQAANEQQRRAIEAQCMVAAWQPPADLEQRYQRVMGGRHHWAPRTPDTAGPRTSTARP